MSHARENAEFFFSWNLHGMTVSSPQKATIWMIYYQLTSGQLLTPDHGDRVPCVRSQLYLVKASSSAEYRRLCRSCFLKRKFHSLPSSCSMMQALLLHQNKLACRPRFLASHAWVSAVYQSLTLCYDSSRRFLWKGWVAYGMEIMEVEPACPCLGGETKHDSHRPLSMREKIKAFNFLCSDSSQRRFKWKGQSPATLYLLLPTRRQRSRTFAANFAVDIIARDEDGLAPCHHAGFWCTGSPGSNKTGT